MTNEQFHALYLLEPLPETREKRRALELWCWYYAETEVYDRGVCVRRDTDGTAIPISRHERALCSQFAAAALRNVVERARNEGISADVMDNAKEPALRMSLRDQQEVAKLDP